MGVFSGEEMEDMALFYGRTNRIAFPILGLALILISSPLCDVRKIALHERLKWLKETIREGSNVDRFDWRYNALDLGLYGVNAIEDLEAGGEEAIYAKFGPFESEEQAVKIRDKISAEVASAKGLYGSREKGSEMTQEDFIRSVREASVFGGTLTPDERESLARGAEKDLRRPRPDDGKVEFFFLTDMNGDGEPDILMGIGGDIYLMRQNRAFLLERRTITYTENKPDNKTVISEGKQRMIENRWDIIEINNTLFFINPYHVATIDSMKEP